MLSTQPRNVTGGGNSPTNYRLIDPGLDQIVIVEITSGKYRGVQFRFGKVAFDDMRLSFTTEIVRKPWRLFLRDLSKDDLFTQVSGDILVELMPKSASDCYNILVG